MALDQTSIPKDLRPLNLGRAIPEDPRIAPVLTTSSRNVEGFYSNPVVDGSSPNSIPVYYPSTLLEAGFGNSGLPNAGPPIVNWAQRVPVGPAGVSPVGHAGIGSVVQAGVSPSGFSYHPSMVARVCVNAGDQASDEGGEDSVSGKKVKFLCSFGGKILPRLSDGALRYVGGQTRILSVKRDVSFNELVQKMVDTYGQPVVIKYQLPDEDLDALVSVSCPEDLENMMDEYEKLVEKSSDGSAKLRVFLFSSNELDSSGSVQFGDSNNTGQKYVEAVNGIVDSVGVLNSSALSKKESVASAASTQNSDLSGPDAVDCSGPAHVDLMVPASINVSSPRANSASSHDPSPRVVYTETNTVPMGIPMVKSQPGSESVPVTVRQQQPLGYDLPQQTASYLQPYLDPHQEPVNRSDYIQHPSHIGFTNANLVGAVGPVYVPQQFIPAMPMPVAPPPSSHIGLNPIQPMVQTRQPRVEESLYGPRVVHLASSPAPSPPVGAGGYVWHHQIPPPPQEQVIYSDGWVTPQQVIYPEKLVRLQDCIMCQKALPHAHSDTLVQEERDSSVSTISDSNPVYHSLHLDDNMRGRLMNRVMVTAPVGEVIVEPQGAGSRGMAMNHIDHEVGAPQVETGGAPQNLRNIDNSYGLLLQENSAHQPSVMNKLLNDICPKGFPGNFLQKEDNIIDYGIPVDPIKDIEGRMENFKIQLPPEISGSNEQQNNKTKLGFDANQMKPTEPLPNSGPYPHHTVGMLSDQDFYTSPAYSGADVAYGISPGERKDEASWFYPNMGPGELDAVPTSGNKLSPSYRIGDIQDPSDSLFSNQDPWNMRHDPHFPPPRPTKIINKMAAVGHKEPFSENQIGNSGNVNSDQQLDDGVLNQLSGNSNWELGSEHVQLIRGSAEDIIKQELQAVAEGVAASVLKSPLPSSPDLPLHEKNRYAHEANHKEVQKNDVEMPHRADNIEEVKPKLPEKAILGFPVSDGIGRLQIIKNSDLEELQELGSGTFGTVYHGKWRGTDVAIKRINDRCFAGKPSEQERMRDDFWNEAIKLAELHHPNVVAFYGVVLDGPGGSFATVTEYMVNGSLRNVLQKTERGLDKRKRLLIAMDVAFGMEYLHGKNIVHFDLKSDNLLVNLRDPHRPICKVGDLGLSKVKCQTLISGGVRGTLPWMAPELLNGSSSLVSEKVDVFSFGIVMWELLTGEEPYADLHYGAIIGGIVSNTLRPPIPQSCDTEWRWLMERCWSSEPSDRPSFTEIANQLRAIASKLPASKISSKAQTQQQQQQLQK